MIAQAGLLSYRMGYETPLAKSTCTQRSVIQSSSITSVLRKQHFPGSVQMKFTSPGELNEIVCTRMDLLYFNFLYWYLPRRRSCFSFANPVQMPYYRSRSTTIHGLHQTVLAQLASSLPMAYPSRCNGDTESHDLAIIVGGLLSKFLARCNTTVTVSICP